MRFHGLEAEEIAADGNLDLALNPKLAWALGCDDLLAMGAQLEAVHPFVTQANRSPGSLLDSEGPRQRLAPEPEQLTLL